MSEGSGYTESSLLDDGYKEKIRAAIEENNEQEALTIYNKRKGELLRTLDYHQEPVILPELQALLRDRGYININKGDSDIILSGIQYISTAALSPPALSIQSVDIPRCIQSAETYSHLGFTDDVAQDLWSQFRGSDRHSPELFLQIAKKHIRKSAAKNSSPCHSDCHAYLVHMGISPAIRAVVLHESLRKISSTASCSQWVEITMDIRWTELHGLNERAIRGLIANTVSDSTSDAAPSPVPTKQSGSAQSSTPTGQSQSISPARVSAVDDGSIVRLAEAFGEFGNMLVAGQEYSHLWRGGTMESLKQLCDQTTPKPVITPMLRRPGDFSGAKPVAYLAVKERVATEFALFHYLLSKGLSSPGVLQFNIPARIPTFNLTKEYLLYDGGRHPDPDIWKKVVYRCRKHDEYLQRILGTQNNPGPEPDLVIGHIACVRDEAMWAMKSHNELTQDHCLHLYDGQRPVYGMQVAIFSDRAQMEFNRLMGIQGSCELKELSKELTDRLFSLGLVGNVLNTSAGVQDMIDFTHSLS
jgi:hypothetical protein